MLNQVILWSDAVFQGQGENNVLMHLSGEKRSQLHSSIVGPSVCCPKKWQEVGLISTIFSSLIKLLLNKSVVPQETVSPQDKTTIVCSVASLSCLKTEEKGKAYQLIASLTEKLSLQRPRATKLACCSHSL